MQVWEYQTIQNWKSGGYLWSASLDAFLNEQGQQGWELVSIVDRDRNVVEWIFKRPVPAARPQSPVIAPYLASAS